MTDIDNISLLDKQLDAYNLLQKILVELNKPQEALAIAEKSRAQNLNLKLSNILSKEKTLVREISIEALRKIASDQNSTIVSYTVFQSQEILIWVIQPDGKIIFREHILDLTELSTFSDLGRLVIPDVGRSQSKQVSEGEDNFSTTNPQNSLIKPYDYLIAPIADYLPKNEKELVIFIPHRELLQVPFAALKNPKTGEYFIENHTISIAPSILSLALTRERQVQLNGSGSGALIVGNPTLSRDLVDNHGLRSLSGAEAEARVIQRLLNVSEKDVLIGAAATEQAVADRIHAAQYVHMATHGLLLNKPRYSTIAGLLALAPSSRDELGEFTVQDILDLTQENPLNAELVVLSACQTGLGAITSDGTFSLARAFMIGGVPSLVVSLRDIPDSATVTLMTAFYAEMLEVGNKAQALRHAMLITMEEYPDPQAWGTFILIGQS